ncbi:MAG: hypothetical protein OHK0046_17560 [Anaerolineae bacterium]
MQLGPNTIELIQPDDGAGRPIPLDSRSNDVWFQHIAIVVRDIDTAYARLREHDVQHVSSMPQTLPDTIPGAAGIKAFYFRDTDGHNLELIQFPADKGDPIWQQQSNVHWSTDSLFLGIDHTAIAVSSTKQSLAFYRDLLGLTVAGTSENFGPEQERLNMVFGAHLEITGLKARQGIGLEFLRYLSPPGGRPMPEDTDISDLWAWQTHMRVDDLDALLAALPADTPRSAIRVDGSHRMILIRDPDDHILRITESEA